MNINEYWKDIDRSLEQLVKKGFVKLPSLDTFNLTSIGENISNEMGSSTFKEFGLSHKEFLDKLEINKYLAPKLFEIAQNFFNFKGNYLNQYHVARKVDPGNSKEMYRIHFDSHLFTMVLPIKIPTPINNGFFGELIYFPNVRLVPKNEFTNFIGKAYYKRFSSKDGLEKLSLTHKKIIDNFNDYRPLIFNGNTTLHTNHPVSLNCSSYRLTLLAHFFDPSPKYGIGNVLRKIRNR